MPKSLKKQMVVVTFLFWVPLYKNIKQLAVVFTLQYGDDKWVWFFEIDIKGVVVAYVFL